MELRQIRQFSRLVGTNRNPDVNEHQAVPRWDNNAGYFTYIRLTTNSKTVEGMVAKGDDSAAGNYIWKLDASKNPAWRKEQFLVSVAKNPSGNNAIFTMNDGETYSLPLGSLAWSNDTIENMLVTSVFGRVGDVIAVAGDYTAAQVTNAFDVTTDTLGDITEGNGSYHFTTAYRIFLDTLVANNIDQITNIGSGQIITDAERLALQNVTVNIEETIRDTVAAFIQNGQNIVWAHDDPGDTLTPQIDFTSFTTDDIPEGTTNLYNRSSEGGYIATIILPSAATVAGRISGAVEGVNYPVGWTLDSDGIDFIVNHGLDKRVANVTVFSNSGSIERQLFGNAAYSGIFQTHTISYDQLTIESLATIETEIVIHILFSNVSGSVAPVVVLPAVTTYTPYDITSSSFVTGGTVTSDGGATVTSRGIEVSLVPEMDPLTTWQLAGGGVGFFSVLISALNPFTTYYYRAFATNSVGTAYGSIFNFTTAVA
jgi:hypothetical protein